MKSRERYKLLNYAKKEYSEIFGRNYQFKKLSRRALYTLLENHKCSAMCEWWYCCRGLYDTCWQEPIEEGIWDATRKDVDDAIKHVIDSTARICKKDSRVLYCEDKYGIQVVIIARDILQCDYLITFTDQESNT